MSATGNLSTGQFGSVSQGTYDAEANRRWNEEHFRPVRKQQFQQMKSHVTRDLAEAKSARARGDRPAAARALTKAAGSRRVVQSWSHLNR